MALLVIVVNPLGGILASRSVFRRQPLQKLIEPLHRNRIFCWWSKRWAKAQLILNRHYLSPKCKNFALKAKILFLQCRIAHHRLAVFLIDHGLCVLWERVSTTELTHSQRNRRSAENPKSESLTASARVKARGCWVECLDSPHRDFFCSTGMPFTNKTRGSSS